MSARVIQLPARSVQASVLDDLPVTPIARRAEALYQQLKTLPQHEQDTALLALAGLVCGHAEAGHPLPLTCFANAIDIAAGLPSLA